jgi:RES domain-containing protein
MHCDWRSYVANGRNPPSWRLARYLISQGYAGILVPSFAREATHEDQNLVLWKWSNWRPHMVKVFDADKRLPRNQLSWR